MSATAKWIDLESLPDTQFQVTALSQRILMQVEMAMTRRGPQLALTFDGIDLLLRHGLVDWEGIKDKDGYPVRFVSGKVWHLLESYVHRKHWAELATKVYEHSMLTEADEKNY
ncbi:hypothetical protein [Ferrimonas aestuarii]|uniref:Uncharacterized protein n=1 Tax=Ferrimonas aestuarii TaxID=2569539 RepID=A0A4U1BKX7_9GAMM|nr:hypothetical protein [Ferrimonas aestuarii]TKB53305.1 hypothetical protein FCL42_14645 [Ferrimonas aestuarii]